MRNYTSKEKKGRYVMYKKAKKQAVKTTPHIN